MRCRKLRFNANLAEIELLSGRKADAIQQSSLRFIPSYEFSSLLAKSFNCRSNCTPQYKNPTMLLTRTARKRNGQTNKFNQAKNLIQ